MQNTATKRIFSFLLALMMVFSVFPAQAAATETHDHSQETITQAEATAEAVAETGQAEDSETAVTREQFEQAMADYINAYGIQVGMTDQQLTDAYLALDSDASKAAWDDAQTLKAMATVLSEEDTIALAESQEAETIARFMEIMETAMSPVPIADLTTGVDGVSLSYSTSSGGSATDDAINGGYRITAKGYTAFIFKNATTVTVTITNTLSETANISFSWAATTNNGSFSIAGTSQTATSGSYQAELAAGGKIELKLVSPKGNGNNATLDLTSLKCTQNVDSADITVHFADSLGTVTAGGAGVANGSVTTITADTAFTATPNSGVTFLGWIDNDTYTVKSTSNSYTVKCDGNYNLRAVFTKASEPAWFMAGTGLYDDLTTAANCGASTIILAADGIVSGTHTIPSGVTLLIPYNSANTLCTTSPTNVATTGTTLISLALAESYSQPTPYRTLTLDSTANITVNGAISLSGKIYPANGASATTVAGPTGPTSIMKMNSGSQITVNSGGALYAYGFITGSGSVTAKSGASVYETFQFLGFRGGTASTAEEIKDNRIFPISQYYVQNIEVPLTLESGSAEYAAYAVFASKMLQTGSVKYLANSGAMFTLTSGEAIKTYDGTKDRLNMDVAGDVTISSISIAGLMDSGDYELALNSNITVNLNSGNATIKQDMVLLPGAKVVVGKDATLTLADSSDADKKVSVFLYDKDQWGNFVGIGNKTFMPLTYAPGKTYTRTDADLVDAVLEVHGVVNATVGSLYTTESGAQIISDNTNPGVINLTSVAATKVYQASQGADSAITPVPRDAYSARLKNADGSFTYTENASGTVTYTYTGGVWLCDAHTPNATSCTSDKVCTVCSTLIEKAKDHTPGAAATCTTDQICTVCKDVLVPMLGHIDANANLRCDRCHEPMDAAVAQDNNVNSDDGFLKLYASLDDVPAGSTVTLVKPVTGYTVSKPMTIHVPNGLGFEYEDSVQYTVKINADATIYSVVSNVVCQDAAMTLEYADIISIVGVFGITNVSETTQSGMLVWYGSEYNGNPNDYEFTDNPTKIYSLEMQTEGEYAGKYIAKVAIANRDLRDNVVVRAYVRLEDGSYIYSDVKPYSVSTYANNMLAEGSTASQETKTLAQNLLNLVAATKWYFHEVEPDDKATFDAFEMDTLGLAPAAPAEDKQVQRDEVFTYRAKNLLFQENINVASLYRIANFTESTLGGTIFWTEEDFNAMTADQFKDVLETPENAKNYKGTIQPFEKNPSVEGFVLSAAPKVAAKDLTSGAKFYILAYVTDENGTHHFSGVEAYSVEQYISNTVKSNFPSEAMKYLAKALYVYERSVAAALAPQSAQ